MKCKKRTFIMGHPLVGDYIEIRQFNLREITNEGTAPSD